MKTETDRHGTEVVRVNVKLPAELVELVDQRVKAQRSTRTAFVERALVRLLNGQDRIEQDQLSADRIYARAMTERGSSRILTVALLAVALAAVLAAYGVGYRSGSTDAADAYGPALVEAEAELQSCTVQRAKATARADRLAVAVVEGVR